MSEQPYTDDEGDDLAKIITETHHLTCIRCGEVEDARPTSVAAIERSCPRGGVCQYCACLKCWPDGIGYERIECCHENPTETPRIPAADITEVLRLLHEFWKWCAQDEYCEYGHKGVTTGVHCLMTDCAWCRMSERVTQVLEDAGLFGDD